MATCKARYVRLNRIDRIYVAWPVGGLGSGATVEAALEDGDWFDLTIDGDSAVGYFAGPGFSTPGDAVPVPTTSHVALQITTATTKETFDGGFIQLIP
jgi:hypothetical protein